MAKIGFSDKIYKAALKIDLGRKGIAIRGKEQEGRIYYEEGIAQAMAAFQEVKTSSDPQVLAIAEYTFIYQELQFCVTSDTDTLSSLTQAIQSFDDAFLALQVVDNNTIYQGVDKTFPHKKKYREKGFPKDSFHIACNSHKTRLKNILRTPGLDQIEKDLLKQRFSNLSTAQNGYIEKQRAVLGN